MQFIYAEIQKRGNSNLCYPGMKCFDQGQTAPAIQNIPGVQEAGWTEEDLERRQSRQSVREENNQKEQLCSWLKLVQQHPQAWPFHSPVDTNEVTDYLDVISDPIDLSSIDERMKDNFYHSKQQFVGDLQRMTSNCKKYNSPDTPYYK
jgi:histone acetyltransferase